MLIADFEKEEITLVQIPSLKNKTRYHKKQVDSDRELICGSEHCDWSVLYNRVKRKRCAQTDRY